MKTKTFPKETARISYGVSGKVRLSDIMPNFKIALHNLEQPNLKYGATQ